MPRSSRSLAVASLLAIPLLAGCGAGGVGWSTYPPVRGQAAFGNPNRYPMPQVVTAALRYTLDRYPPPSPRAAAPAPVDGQVPGLGATSEIAINLPEGFSRERYLEIAGALTTDRVAVHPLTPETAALPTYHVAQVRIRGGQATVDVLRPVYDLARATGGELPQQGLTLELQGGLTPWRVESRQIWAIGTIPVPAPNYLPEVQTEPDPDDVPVDAAAAPEAPGAAPRAEPEIIEVQPEPVEIEPEPSEARPEAAPADEPPIDLVPSE